MSGEIKHYENKYEINLHALCRISYIIGRVHFAFLNVPRTYKSSFKKEQKRVDIPE